MQVDSIIIDTSNVFLTLEELSSPSNGHNNDNQNDNNNRIILVNPSINPPLRLTLRLDNNPPSIEPSTSNEAEIVRPSNERGLRLSPLRNNEQIIDVGEASVAPEMIGSPSYHDPLGLQVSINSMRLSPRVSPDLDQDMLSHAWEILPRAISSQAMQISPRIESSLARQSPPRSVSLVAATGTDSN